MSAQRTLERSTARGAVDRWVEQLRAFFESVKSAAGTAGWSAATEVIGIREDPFHLGARLEYEAPVLVLKRPDPRTAEEQRITFEPRNRYTIGAAGRIDVYSYPNFREAMLLRLPDTTGAENLTWEEAEERVATALWKAFSTERLPLAYQLDSPEGVVAFLEDMVHSESDLPRAS
jgi:hypothetical protein